ncbi:hypothetical protein CBL_02177 [Carabus blaptoides fortunei]
MRISSVPSFGVDESKAPLKECAFLIFLGEHWCELCRESVAMIVAVKVIRQEGATSSRVRSPVIVTVTTVP